MKKEGIEVATQVATMIRARIKEATGLNASAGISYCEFSRRSRATSTNRMLRR